MLLGVAQAYATLVLAAAAMAADFGNRAKADAWREAVGATTASRLGLADRASPYH